MTWETSDIAFTGVAALISIATAASILIFGPAG